MTPPAVFRKARPIGPELEFHGDAGDYPEGEVDREDTRPELGGLVIAIVA